MTDLKGGNPKKGISEIRRTASSEDSDVGQAIFNMKERISNRSKVVHQHVAKRAPEGANGSAKDLNVEERVVGVAVDAVFATAAVEVDGETTLFDDLRVGEELVGDEARTTRRYATGKKRRTRRSAGGKDAKVPKRTANVG
mmetsp:Transcript_74371/g.213160  ORF Transcript_74371/g.213160 Transcript_74371/m.213160 type:complete len:141 (+) Transcript_74371:118-540(+)